MTGLLNISAEDAEEYSQSLAQIGEGWWRQMAWAFRQGIPEALGMSREDWKAKYFGHIRVSANELPQAAAELKDEGLTQRETASVLGVGLGSVNRALNPVPTGTIDPQEGENSQEPTPEIDLLVPPGTGEVSKDADDQQLSPMPAVQLNDGDEWYTPLWLFKALGIGFALDVCAPLDRTYSAVPADGHLTIEDDGLAQPWHGTVWCNPPYSQPEPWARRMIHHGDGLLLTHIPMNAGWCVDVWEACDAIRLFQAMEFVRPDGTSQRPGYWLQLAAFGPVATEGLARLQPLGDAAFNKRRVASPMWKRVP